ncbi:MAG: methyl viologen-reducing hydrogenase [Candidatus Marinimicrobia bacterium]|nr:methyl viologen-reducing hydrogenase [Candidatus Neomarinimicrobiota bacterium]
MAKVAEEWLNICGGCEIAILDLGEKLLDVLPSLEFVHMPVLMDHKYFGQTGELDELEIPEADVGMVSGGIRNEKEKHVAEEMRKKCGTLIALGSCACFGGIPALANMYNLEELYDKVYRDSKTTESADTPSDGLPALTDRVYALSEVVDVDLQIPGCPMNPVIILEALSALLEGKPFELPERSVCDDCPTKREEKSDVGLKRPLQDAEFVPEEYSSMRCLNEQGVLCLGPVTRSGCGKQFNGGEIVPRCIKGFMPCRGCFGPIREGANPLIDMMTALSSIGLDAKLVEDRRALLNRYIGGQNRLRPLPVRR